MTHPTRSRPITFQMVINDAEWTDEQISTIEAALKNTLLQEIAKIDTRGDLCARELPTARGIGFAKNEPSDGGHTAGMHISMKGQGV